MLHLVEIKELNRKILWFRPCLDAWLGRAFQCAAPGIWQQNTSYFGDRRLVSRPEQGYLRLNSRPSLRGAFD
jgi:hypothetical protein